MKLTTAELLKAVELVNEVAALKWDDNEVVGKLLQISDLVDGSPERAMEIDEATKKAL